MPTNTSLPILKIQRFSTHDGPGIRTTVFIQGCPLHCQWCHNPESQILSPQIFFTPSLCIGCEDCSNICPKSAHDFSTGLHIFDRTACIKCMKCCKVCPTKALEPVSTTMTISQVMQEIKKDVVFFGKEGGITLSGGEPLFHAEESLLLLREAKAAGINTAIETCGYFDEKWIPFLTKSTDLFLWDIKDTNTKRHRQNTGVSNQKIIHNLFSVDEKGGKTVLRYILLNKVNTNMEDFDNIAKIYHKLKHCLGVEIFSYHHFGESKYDILGRTYKGKKEWIVSDEQLRYFSSYLKTKNVTCKLQQ